MEVGVPFVEIGGSLKCEATFSDDGVEFLDGFEILVGDRLVEHRPEAFGWLQLWTIGRQIDEAEAVGHGQARFGVPPGAVDHQDDHAILADAGFAGEERQQLLEKRLGDTVGDVPECLSTGRRDKGGDVEPLETMVPERHRALTARRPATPAEWLQTEPVFVGGEDFNGRLRVALGFFRGHLGKFF